MTSDFTLQRMFSNARLVHLTTGFINLCGSLRDLRFVDENAR